VRPSREPSCPNRRISRRHHGRRARGTSSDPKYRGCEGISNGSLTRGVRRLWTRRYQGRTRLSLAGMSARSGSSTGSSAAFLDPTVGRGMRYLRWASCCHCARSGSDNINPARRAYDRAGDADAIEINREHGEHRTDEADVIMPVFVAVAFVISGLKSSAGGGATLRLCRLLPPDADNASRIPGVQSPNLAPWTGSVMEMSIANIARLGVRECSNRGPWTSCRRDPYTRRVGLDDRRRSLATGDFARGVGRRVAIAMLLYRSCTCERLPQGIVGSTRVMLRSFGVLF